MWMFLILSSLLHNHIFVEGLFENGFSEYKIQLTSKEKTKNGTLRKSMYSDSDITYTINCKPPDIKGKKFHFTVKTTVMFNQCHQPHAIPSDQVFYEIYRKIPCGMLVLSELKTTLVPSNSTKNKSSTNIESQRKITGMNSIGKFNRTGIYTIIIIFLAVDGEMTDTESLEISGKIESKHSDSYLSAISYPLLPFYGVMSLVYLGFAVIWLVSSCCNWKDLLRVQFWIGGVIALGMFENAVYYSEYKSVSLNGKAMDLLYFAEIVSSAKRALARVLVIIVSIGFGIVKPRLGQTLHKVIIVGGLYFILASIEGCIRIKDEIEFINNKQIFALVPLTVLDVCIIWWVFTALLQTTRTLRIRKNVVKLTLYRHFTNTLIFSVLASLLYMIYVVKENRFSDCINIKTFWLNEALWPFLFAVILAVIMFLWRPSVNNQRYAFTPLDLDDDENDDDMTLSDAFGEMKMRTKSETAPKNRKSAEDDLRWVEENIPSVPSTLLPTIDSDEEIITTKFEQSKMD